MRSQRWTSRCLVWSAVFVLVAGCSAGTTPTPGSSTSPAPPVMVATTAPTEVPTVAAASPTAAPVSPSAAALTGLDRVKAAGTLVWCSDTTFPPYESVGASGSAEGLDIDIATEVSTRMGVTSRIDNTGWDSLLSNVGEGKCDLVISGMTSTFGNRKDQVDFVDYLKPWTAFLVATGNPKKIHTLDDLAGKSVAVVPGFANEASLGAASDMLVAAGKPAIKILTGPLTEGDWTSAEWANQLASGTVDALAGDSANAAYHATKPPYAGVSEVGGPAIDPQPVGIAIRKGEADVKDAVAAAVKAMTVDGTMKALVAKWGMADHVGLVQ